jgi:glycosyltransferase involved in cell wall biosynthesis
MNSASTEWPVAVVITTYNHAHYLPDSIGSILSQTMLAAEIIVVDDGSTDNAAEVVSRYGGVKYIRQVNQGLSAARNTGLYAATAKLILFLDADDRLLPEAIETGVACFAQTPDAAYVYGGHRRVSEDGRPITGDRYTAIGPRPYEDMLRGNVIGMIATVLFNTRILADEGGYDISLRRCEDYDVYLRLAAKYPVASHPTIIAEYRWHASNMSANHSAMLETVLQVHQRHERQTDTKLRQAWDDGRRIWSEYYTMEMLKSAWASATQTRSPALVWKNISAALRSNPSFVRHEAALRISSRLPRSVDAAFRRLLGKRPPVGSVRLGDFDRTKPVSFDFGWDRGTPVDRVYVAQYIEANRDCIQGRVLEIGDDSYSRRFGGDRIARQDILHVHAGNPIATIVGDLSVSGTLPEGAFDCMVVVQTLHLIYDMKSALAELHRALRPGGTLLLTVPGITPVDRGEWHDIWFWSLTPASAPRLVGDVFGRENVAFEVFGNAYSATMFLQGLASQEIDMAKLTEKDKAFPVIIGLRATRSHDT